MPGARSTLLAKAKFMPYLTPFKLFPYLINENHYVPWYFYNYILTNHLANNMNRTEYRESVMQFQRRLTSAHYTSIDFWDDSKGTNIDKNFRQLIIEIACSNGSPQCLSDAYKKFSLWKQSNGSRTMLPPNMRSNILFYGVRFTNDTSDYDFVWQQYLKESDSSTLKLTYLQAISFISNWDYLKPYIDLSMNDLNETVVTTSNCVSFFISVIENYAHESNAWKIFVNNHSKLSNNIQFGMVLNKFATYAVTNERKQEISTFVNANPYLFLKDYRTEALQTMHSNIEWMNSHKSKVGEWLTQNACGDVRDSKTPQACPWSSPRIDKTASHPTAYNLLIQVNATTNVYNGTVDVLVTTTKLNLQYLTLNAASKLAVNLVSIAGPNNQSIGAQMFRYTPQDYVVVEFSEPQPPAQYVLKFNFSSSLEDSGLAGLYNLSNNTFDGCANDGSNAATQLDQFNQARRMFPCYDEPAFKARFTVSIIHESKMNATLSNMDIDSSEAIVDHMPHLTMQTKFKQSPLMSSYMLVAMLVGDFVCANETLNSV